MPIEWWPRGPYGGQSWLESDVADQYRVNPPHLDDAGSGDVAVVVPVLPRGTGRAFPVSWSGLGLRIGVNPLIVCCLMLPFGALSVLWGLITTKASDRLPGLVTGCVLLLVGLAGLLRLQPVENRVARGSTLTVGPGGITVDRLRVPWSVVEEVVTFRCRLTPADDLNDNTPYSWLAVRVRDFDAVLGLSPWRAGLANLTRRRLVLLVEASEVARPWALRDALVQLVEHPEARPSLATAEGVRLLTHGPAGPVSGAA